MKIYSVTAAWVLAVSAMELYQPEPVLALSGTEIVVASSDINPDHAFRDTGSFAQEEHDIRRLAKEGDRETQLLLGTMYLAGQGVPRNFVQAYVWCNLAAIDGNLEALECLAKLTNIMTPRQIEHAQGLSYDLFQKIGREY